MEITVEQSKDKNFIPQEWKIVQESKIEFTLMFHPYPTNNCQIYSLSRIQHLFDNYDDIFIDILRKAKRKTNSLLIDVNVRYLKNSESLKKIKKSFIINTPYTNLTGSKMVMLLIDLNKAIGLLKQ